VARSSTSLSQAVSRTISSVRRASVRVELDSVRVTVGGDFSGDPAVSDAITYDVELSGRGDPDALVREVDRIAEIPNTIRQGAPISLRKISIV
jgi:putative redox protein